MQIGSREIHVADFRRGMQAVQNVSELLGMVGLDAALRSVKEEPFQALVPKALDHSSSVTHGVTFVKGPG